MVKDDSERGFGRWKIAVVIIIMWVVLLTIVGWSKIFPAPTTGSYITYTTEADAKLAGFHTECYANKLIIHNESSINIDGELNNYCNDNYCQSEEQCKKDYDNIEKCKYLDGCLELCVNKLKAGLENNNIFPIKIWNESVCVKEILVRDLNVK